MGFGLFFLSLMAFASLYGQTDTLYYDPASGNYIIRYLGTTVGNQDTMVTVVYEPPTKIDPKVEGFVYPSSHGDYAYRYRITNGPLAEQNLNEYSLHFGDGVSVESVTPTTSWDNVRPKNFLPDTGFASRWVWRGHQGLQATWYVDSCIIISDGLPSITDSYTQAKKGIWVWPAGGPNQKDTLASDIRTWLLKLRAYPNMNVLRKTVGPKLPPEQFQSLGFLDTLKSYITQSRSLGWITRQATTDKYTRLVDSVRLNLLANNHSIAKTKLDSILLYVHADSATTLTSEAYALIRFNTEYLKTIIVK